MMVKHSVPNDDLAQQVACCRFLPCISGTTSPSHNLLHYSLAHHSEPVPAQRYGKLARHLYNPQRIEHVRALGSTERTRQARVQQLRLTYTAYCTHPLLAKAAEPANSMPTPRRRKIADP
jgi:hypothetical protein